MYILISGTVSLVKIMKWHVVKTWQLPTVDKWVGLRPGLYRVLMLPLLNTKFKGLKSIPHTIGYKIQYFFTLAREIIKLWVKWHCLTTLASLRSEVQVLYFLLIYFFFSQKRLNECEINWRAVRVTAGLQLLGRGWSK